MSSNNAEFAEESHAKPRIATVSLAGCFGCHMSLLDIDERLFTLLDLVEFDRSPLTDIKTCAACDIGFIEGGLCNSENVQILREFRSACDVLIAVGACAISGGLPAQRNGMDIGQILMDVYQGDTSQADSQDNKYDHSPARTPTVEQSTINKPDSFTSGKIVRRGLSADSVIPSDPELPLPLARVHAIQDVVHVDHFLPGCPPSGDAIWSLLTQILDTKGKPTLDRSLIHYD